MQQRAKAKAIVAAQFLFLPDRRFLMIARALKISSAIKPKVIIAIPRAYPGEAHEKTTGEESPRTRARRRGNSRQLIALNQIHAAVKTLIRWRHKRCTAR